MTGSAEDLDLVRRVREGDQSAFEALVHRHERSLYNLAFRMLGPGEDARDAVQEAFLSCYRHLDTFRGDSLFSTWLHRITLNACYDLLRRRRPISSLEDEKVERAPNDDHSEAVALSTDIQRALLELPAEYRAVLVLHEIIDQPVEEIAAALDIPIGTVKSRLHRGRVALGRALSPRTEPDRHPAPSNPPSQ